MGLKHQSQRVQSARSPCSLRGVIVFSVLQSFEPFVPAWCCIVVAIIRLRARVVVAMAADAVSVLHTTKDSHCKTSHKLAATYDTLYACLLALINRFSFSPVADQFDRCRRIYMTFKSQVLENQGPFSKDH